MKHALRETQANGWSQFAQQNPDRAVGFEYFWVDVLQDQTIKSRFFKATRWASTPFVE